MDYRVERQEDYVILKLPAKVVVPGSIEMKNFLEDLYEQGVSMVSIDCSELEMLDTSGISSIAIYQKRFKERGGGLKVINVRNDYIKHLFETIELYKIVDIEGLPQKK